MRGLLLLLLLAAIFLARGSTFSIEPEDEEDILPDIGESEGEDIEQFDLDQYLNNKNVVKRKNTGSCTCTCETKPASKKQRAKESATLLRTAAGSNHRPSVKTDSVTQTKSALAPKPKIAELEPNRHDDEMPNDQPNIAEDESRVASSKTNTKASEENAVEKFESSWGHESRFPWRRLPDRMCFRERCESDSDCCLRYNLCDRSAQVCVDCWYRSPCMSERDCCLKYPYCQRTWSDGKDGAVSGGKCVEQM